jgi:putative ABC transport system permease protein
MALVTLALRNLQRNRKRTTITLVALVVGVGAMVAVRGFIVGFRGMIVENQSQGLLGTVQVHHAGYVANVQSSPLTLDMADSPAFRALLQGVPGVRTVAPRIDFGAQLSTPDRRPPPADGGELAEADRGTSTFLIATGFDPALERDVTPKRWEWVAAGRGGMPPSADSPSLVLNDDFARALGLELLPVGAPLPPVERQVALIAGDREQALNGENVVLGGTFASVTPNDRRVGFVSLGLAQRLLRMEGRVTEYALSLQPGASPLEVKAALQARLGPAYEVHTWEERIPFVTDLVETQTRIFDIVSSIVLLVVLLGIVNAMLMSVLERVREIGTMLAVGMRRRQVVLLFLLEGAGLGVVGGVLGVTLGVLVVWWMGQAGIALPAPGARVASIIHPTVEPLFVARTLGLAIAGSALASIIPARRAAALRPVEALAHA